MVDAEIADKNGLVGAGTNCKSRSTAVRFELTRVTPIDFESIALTARPSCQTDPSTRQAKFTDCFSPQTSRARSLRSNHQSSTTLRLPHRPSPARSIKFQDEGIFLSFRPIQCSLCSSSIILALDRLRDWYRSARVRTNDAPSSGHCWVVDLRIQSSIGLPCCCPLAHQTAHTR